MLAWQQQKDVGGGRKHCQKALAPNQNISILLPTLLRCSVPKLPSLPHDVLLVLIAVPAAGDNRSVRLAHHQLREEEQQQQQQQRPLHPPPRLLLQKNIDHSRQKLTEALTHTI